jgi:hypothetical protein
MIDYVKITINEQGTAERLLNNPELNWITKGLKHEAVLQQLKVIAHDSGRVEVAGSLHKYWTGGYNWNDFGRVDLFDVIHEVCAKLGIEPKNAKIQNLEFGVNITPPINATEVCKRLISYKDVGFWRVNYQKGYFVEATKTDYYVKCYDKGRQQDRAEAILRFERKAMTAKNLKRMGVATLADLLRVECLRRLGDELLKTFEGVVVDEGLEGLNLTATERRTLKAVTDAREWERLKKQHKRRAYLLEQYAKIVGKYRGDKPLLKEQLRAAMGTKWEELLGVENWAVLHNLETVSNNRAEGTASTTEHGVLGGFPDLCIVVKPTTPLRRSRTSDGGLNSIPKCGNCGRVLVEPTYKSATGGGLYCDAVCEAQKKQRNDRSNPRNDFKRKYERIWRGTHLFDLNQHIKLNDQQRIWLGEVAKTSKMA